MPVAPVAIFAYNRPERLDGLLKSLQRCEDFESTPVRIFIDGPRSAGDRLQVDAVRALASGLALPNVQCEISETNRGLRRSIFHGVSQLCDEHGKVIVLEDDLVLSPIALRYFNAALDRYEADDRVWSVSGYLYDTPQYRDFRRALILPYAHSWGWATWNRAWSRFDLDARPSDEDLRSAAFRQAFDMNGLYPFTEMLRNSCEGLINSWYAHWYYTIFKNGGRSIFPPRRVVENYGISQGTHGGSLNPHERLVRRPALLEDMVAFGDPSEVDYLALDRIKSCREARVQRFVARAGSLRKRLRRRFRN